MASFKVINVESTGRNASELEHLLGEGYFIKCHHTIPGMPATLTPLGSIVSESRPGCVQYVLYKSQRED